MLRVHQAALAFCTVTCCGTLYHSLPACCCVLRSPALALRLTAPCAQHCMHSLVRLDDVLEWVGRVQQCLRPSFHPPCCTDRGVEISAMSAVVAGVLSPQQLASAVWRSRSSAFKHDSCRLQSMLRQRSRCNAQHLLPKGYSVPCSTIHNARAAKPRDGLTVPAGCTHPPVERHVELHCIEELHVVCQLSVA